MVEKSKKGGFLSKLGFKSKDEKRAFEAAQKAAQQKQIDEKMAARMAAINAAALKSAREQDQKYHDKNIASKPEGKDDVQPTKTDKLPSDAVDVEAEELKQAKIQAAKDVARAKLLAQELAEKTRAAQLKDQEQLKEQAPNQDTLSAEKIKAEALKAERAAKIAGEKAARDLATRDLAAKDLAAKPRNEIPSIGDSDDMAVKAKSAAPSPKPSQAPENPEGLEAPEQFLGRISQGLRKSTNRIGDQLTNLFSHRKLDDVALEELEDILISADLGTSTAAKVTSLLAEDKFDKNISDMDIKIALADVISNILTPLETPLAFGLAKPQILLFVGVNGSGKTTTLGKLAKHYTDQGQKVLIAAGDTFRAAAGEQLTIWAQRAKAQIMQAPNGADAAGLVYDAIERARKEDFDMLMIDTAGRLQNRTELMDELSKIIRVVEKQDPSAPHHTLLVLDATVGQNALMQTEAFAKSAGVTGLIMTKLDGTAKGGVLVALADKYGLPIHHIGIGEQIEDLQNFSATVFAAALSGIADSI